MTSCVSILVDLPATQIPSPGAVWPAMVMYGADVDRTLEVNDPGDAEDDDARAAGFTGFAEAARARHR